MNYLLQPLVFLRGLLTLAVVAGCYASCAGAIQDRAATAVDFSTFSSPAGRLPATRETFIDGHRAAVLPSGRVITPAGLEVEVDAPKPFGMALSPDGQMLATVNSGASRFSVSLIRHLKTAAPATVRIDVNASFLGVAFAPDSKRFYLAGGENGNIWIGDTEIARIIGSVNLNGVGKPLDKPLNVVAGPVSHFKGTFPGQLVLSPDGRYLYVVDQAGFKVHVIDTGKIETGVDDQGNLVKPNNFKAVAARIPVGRYPYGIQLSADGNTLLVSHVGIFEYTHLLPKNPTGDANIDYPLCYPGAGYPDETRKDRVIDIKKVDPSNLSATLTDPDGIRCGYVAGDMSYRVPGLGNPNSPKSSSVYVFDATTPTLPKRVKIVKTGPLVGEKENGIATYSGSHPNAIAFGPNAVYVANGNNDSVSVLHPKTFKELSRIPLALLKGQNRKIKGVQPVALTVSPDGQFLYVAEAGINAVGVIRLMWICTIPTTTAAVPRTSTQKAKPGRLRAMSKITTPPWV